MKLFACLVVTALVAAVATAECMADDAACLFEEFKVKYNRVYATPEEATKRFHAFEERLKEIKILSAENPEATFGINKFADLTSAEFQATYLNLDESELAKVQLDPAPPTVNSPRALPDSYTTPWITPVLDQRQCGSCWAFATACVVEGALKKKTPSSSPRISTQQLVDCSSGYGNHGCDGGNYNPALQYLKAAGIMAEMDYPYEALTKSCRFSSSRVAYTIDSYFSVSMANYEAGLAQAIYDYGPIAIALDARSLQSYTSGLVYNEARCRVQVNHAVTAIGWGMSGTTKYWLVRNSWGTGWGESGNFRIVRGVGACMMNVWSGAGAVAGAGGSTCVPKTCGTQKCGSISNGCGATISCGTCSSGQVCTSDGQCAASGGVSDWKQVNPSSPSWFTVTKGSSLVVSLIGSTTTAKKHIAWDTSAPYIQAAWSSFSAQVVASSGVFGLGMRFGQSTGSYDGMSWQWDPSPSGNTAKLSLCLGYYGSDSCTVVNTAAPWTKGVSNNVTVNFGLSGTSITTRPYVNQVATLGNTYYLVSTSYYPSLGKAYIVAAGASKTFTSPRLITRSGMRVAMSVCMTPEEWVAHISRMLGIPPRNVEFVKGTNADGCDAGTFKSFDYTLTDADTIELPGAAVATENFVYSTTLAEQLTKLVNGGSMAEAGVSVSEIALVAPAVTGVAATVAAPAGAAGLSAGAIAGIVVGSVVFAALVAGAITTAVVVARLPTPAEPIPETYRPRNPMRKTLYKLYTRGQAVNLEPGPGPHKSITARAPGMEAH